MENGNIVLFTCNIMAVIRQRTLCDGLDTENHTTGPLFVPLGLSEVEIYTFLAVTQHGVHSNKILALRKVTRYWLGAGSLRSCGSVGTVQLITA